MRPITRSLILRALACLLAVVAVSSCGGDATGPDPQPEETVLPANPDGILLPGDPGDNAVSHIVAMDPSPVDEADIVDGLLSTRFDAWVAPGVTVAQVNEALTATGARLVSMRRGIPLVTLRVDAMADESAATARAAEIQAWPAFLIVIPAREPRAAPVPRGAGKTAAAPDKNQPETGMLPHLDILRMAAAWNALPRALAVNHPVPVLVLDAYSQLTPHPEIAALTFPADAKGKNQEHKNHGWHVAGILGADYEGDLPTGVHPAAADLMPMLGLPIGGLSWAEMCGELVHHFPATGKFVISTSLGWGFDPAAAAANGGNWPVQELVEGATLALAWRIQTAPEWDRFFHATAAGNEAEYAGNMKDARIESPWTIAHFYADPRTIFAAGALSPAQQAALDALVGLVQTTYPAAVPAQPNVIVVGSSDFGGEQSVFSNLYSEIRVLGEDVVSTCRAIDAECDGTFQLMGGTSMATPQVAALAAWLWNLAPNLTPLDVYDRLLRAYTSSNEAGVANGYLLTLSADASPANAPVRRALLDVAGSAPEPGSNGLFDEADVELFLTFFESYELERQQTGFNNYDYSRYDLNGDNYTGGAFASPFDLTVDGLPEFGNATFNVGGTAVTIAETAATDLDCLCHEAYSAHYDGDETARDALLLERCGGSFSGITVQINGLPGRIEPETATPITIVAGLQTPGGIQYVEGIDLYIRTDDGDAVENSGTTDANGMFSTSVSLDAGYNELTVIVNATYQEAVGVATASVLRPNKIEFGIRQTTVAVDVNAGYCPEAFVVCLRPISSWNEVYNVDTGPLDEAFTRSGSATMVGMSVQGEASVTGQSTLTLDGDAFQAVTFHSEMDGSITLTNPNHTILSYSASAESWAEMELSFTVWGDPASYTLGGSVDAIYYDVELSGDETAFWCDDFDSPCTALSGAGLLPPGEYDLDVYAEIGGWIGWYEDGCQECVPSGTEGASGMIDVTFTVTH